MFGRRAELTAEQATQILDRNNGQEVTDRRFSEGTTRILFCNGSMRGKIFEFPSDEVMNDALARLNQASRIDYNHIRICPSHIEFIGIAESIGATASLFREGPKSGHTSYTCENESHGETLGTVHFPGKNDIDLFTKLFEHATGCFMGSCPAREE
ncbi:MAG: hypothetical protein KDD55_01130 [Bdellovibrionales bacterium]|nr:hypothetical protein [Bdellovibrionales bacterium]